MRKRYLFGVAVIAAISISQNKALAQGVAVNTTGATADNSAILDVNSTSQGVLVPRMVLSQRTAIAAPATGLLVYQTDATAGFYYYNGSAWTSLSSPSSLPPSGAAGGDLTGSSYPNPTIANGAVTGTKIAGNTITDANINTGAAIAYSKISGGPISLPPNGTASGDLTGSYPAPALATTGVTAGGYGSATVSPTFNVDAKGRITSVTNNTITGTTPGGAAGGDLTGSNYPNPTIASGAVTGGKIASNTITDANINSGAAIAYSKISGGPTSLPPNGTAGGDLTGSYPSPTIGAGKVVTADIAANAVTIAKLPSGASATTFLKGDGTWGTPAASSALSYALVSVVANGSYSATDLTKSLFLLSYGGVTGATSFALTIPPASSYTAGTTIAIVFTDYITAAPTAVTLTTTGTSQSYVGQFNAAGLNISSGSTVSPSSPQSFKLMSNGSNIWYRLPF